MASICQCQATSGAHISININHLRPSSHSYADANRPHAVIVSLFCSSRYQFVAGIVEERGIEEFVADRRICNALSFIVRTSNTFVGSLLWLDFVRCARLKLFRLLLA